MTKAEDWQQTLEDLDSRRRQARAMGGPERLDKQHGLGKLDARTRVERLLDPGTFRELGTIVGGEVAADAIVTGWGRINGVPVMVGAEDFTTLAGTIAPGSNSKRYRIAELALRDKIPLVMLLEGAGFRPTGTHYGRSPTDLLAQTRCSGRVPTVAAVLGSSAGHGALVAPICDFTVMSRQGAIFTAGPPVVKESTGEDISKEALGGPDVALTSGVIHNVADDDAAALDTIRRYLSYFPPSAWSYPPPLPASEATPGQRSTPELLDIVSRDNRRIYDMRSVLDVVFDSPDWLEVQPHFGGRSSAPSPTSGAIRSRSSPTSRRYWPGPSTPTLPTRPHTSSRWPTPSTCRSFSWPTTRACCRAAGLNVPAYCAAGHGCSPRRPRPPR
ncbi:carboxyl transferase domain protein [Mycobacterium kansasii]|uniref:Carboxyl transferase domain protein n=1 Tax=Mycobacterium kansasii TaxID=1768 RepID=A0A1V3XFZ7_MYCKA|nr:carboxyl transferase domain protein [Mycobacterium kansasii]